MDRPPSHFSTGGDTSGLLRALQGKGIEDIAEMECTGNSVLVHDFYNGFGAGNGTKLNDPGNDNPPILFPEIRFFTNDTWGIIRGVAGAKGFPIVLMNRYSKGIFYVLNIPENISDLYNLPEPVVSAIKGYLMEDFPVRVESPPGWPCSPTTITASWWNPTTINPAK